MQLWHLLTSSIHVCQQEDETIAEQVALAQAKFGSLQFRKGTAATQDVRKNLVKIIQKSDWKIHSPLRLLIVLILVFYFTQKKKFDSADYFSAA